MKNMAMAIAIATGLSFTACKSDKDEITIDKDVINTPFKQGTIDMGMFMGDIDIAATIDAIDFSRDDAKQQFEEYVNSLPPDENLFTRISELQNNNPLAALGALLSISKATYYIKDQAVMGEITGFGWSMDHFHDRGNDLAKMYLTTLVQTDEIPDEDRQIYATYKPSENEGAGNRNSLDLDLYDRVTSSTKVNVEGYLCDVATYQMKTQTGGDIENPVNKIVVYTSPLFDKTINFTHPYYLPESGGILRLDIYLEDSNTPTLVMRPVSINEEVLSNDDLSVRTSTPVYDINDLNLGLKSFGILLSGWGVLQ
ncbi:hypothetical protein EIM50_16720 [Pseudoxanthomonas sp. SGD-10]|nr:hypothetical protein EIM50_16720 [Pseudoxanthomonas sp. SGD-10]